jgi:hypothetical protein
VKQEGTFSEKEVQQKLASGEAMEEHRTFGEKIKDTFHDIKTAIVGEDKSSASIVKTEDVRANDKVVYHKEEKEVLKKSKS